MNLKEMRAVIDKEEFHIGDRLRLARLGSGMTVEETASRMGLKASTHYGREGGKDSVGIKYVSRFEDSIGIKQGTLMQNSCKLSSLEVSENCSQELRHIYHRGPNGHRAEVGIEETIRRRISDKTYSDKIPPIRELIREFGYSRPIISSALKSLKKEGILVGKKKAGTFIADK